MAPIQRAPTEVRRILARLTFERLASGWSAWALAHDAGVHYSVIQRWENGKVTNPLVSLLAAFAQPLGLRLDLIAERHVPLMNLTEEEIRAIKNAAAEGLKSLPPRHRDRKHARSALAKMEKTDEGVADDAR